MSLEDAEHAVREFLDVIEEGRDMAQAGKVGAEFDELLGNAKDLLDIVDEELRDVDREQHAELIAASPILRQKLERLRDELRGGAAN